MLGDPSIRNNLVRSRNRYSQLTGCWINEISLFRVVPEGTVFPVKLESLGEWERNMKRKRNRSANAGTSAESIKKSDNLAIRLRERILVLAEEAGPRGLTINEAERLIDDHKGHSISPRFSELIDRGILVRVQIGLGRPTKRFPNGDPRYAKRYDEDTCRNVTIHWLPEFALSPDEFCSDEASTAETSEEEGNIPADPVSAKS